MSNIDELWIVMLFDVTWMFFAHWTADGPALRASDSANHALMDVELHAMRFDVLCSEFHPGGGSPVAQWS